MTRILTIIALLFATPMLAACASGDYFVRAQKASLVVVTLNDDVLYKGVEAILKGTRYQLLESNDGQRFVWDFGRPKCGVIGGCQGFGLELDEQLCVNGVAIVGELYSFFPLERLSLKDRRKEYSPRPCFSIVK